MNRDLAEVLWMLNPDSQGLGNLLTDQAREIGDLVHHEIKRRIPSHPSVRATIAVGVSVAVQVLAETLTFADNSMGGQDDEDAVTVRSAAAQLFSEMFAREHPNLLRPIGNA